MLVRVDAGGQMVGRKPGRRGEQHDIDAAVDHFLVGVETEKLIRCLDLHSAASFEYALSVCRD